MAVDTVALYQWISLNIWILLENLLLIESITKYLYIIRVNKLSEFKLEYTYSEIFIGFFYTYRTIKNLI